MKSYLAAAIQMTSTPWLEKNLAEAEELIDLAVRQGAELVSLPENFPFMGEEAEKMAQAETIAQTTEKFLKTCIQNAAFQNFTRIFMIFVHACFVHRHEICHD